MATLSERLLGSPAGSFTDLELNRAYAHDGTGLQALLSFLRMETKVRSPEKISIIYDHIVPANNSETANLQHELRDFSREAGFDFHDIGEGICHQVMSEGICMPGEVVVGADSHTCTLGAFGAFATGVGATDMAAIWATGETWFRVPETTGIILEGTLKGPAEPKDLALACVTKLGMDGATYRALEFTGDGAGRLEMEGRLTVCNMAIEAGAKAGLFYADDRTVSYLAEFGKDTGDLKQAPEDCTYADEIPIDLDDIVPVISAPHRVDNAVPVEKYEGIHLDQVFVGTCTNGRYEDLKRFADIVRGKKVAVRTIVVPASKRTLMKCIETGVLADIVAAGCSVGTPGCGPCLGAHMGTLGEGEVGLSTANRNFKNRMGVGAEYYLCSPSTAAASALKGEIASPEAGL